MSVILETDLKRKGASPPVSARNMRFLTGQLALFRLKRLPLSVGPMSVIFETDLKRKGASPPVSARSMRFLTGQLALFRLKVARTGR